jgi:hypothetical protein
LTETCSTGVFSSVTYIGTLNDSVIVIKQSSHKSNSISTPSPYFYSYDNAALTFRLCACLENAADSDVQGGSSCASCGGYQCASGKCYIVNSD